MAKCRKKTVVIDYWRWSGITRLDARQFCEANGLPLWNVGIIDGATGLMVPISEGTSVARQGDYILRDIKGRYCPCEKDIFEEGYEVLPG